MKINLFSNRLANRWILNLSMIALLSGCANHGQSPSASDLNSPSPANTEASSNENGGSSSNGSANGAAPANAEGASTEASESQVQPIPAAPTYSLSCQGTLNRNGSRSSFEQSFSWDGHSSARNQIGSVDQGGFFVEITPAISEDERPTMKIIAEGIDGNRITSNQGTLNSTLTLQSANRSSQIQYTVSCAPASRNSATNPTRQPPASGRILCVSQHEHNGAVVVDNRQMIDWSLSNPRGSRAILIAHPNSRGRVPMLEFRAIPAEGESSAHFELRLISVDQTSFIITAQQQLNKELQLTNRTDTSGIHMAISSKCTPIR